MKDLHVSLKSPRTITASFKADPELWSRFREETVLRGVSTCHVLEALMEAWIEGQRATATVIKPVTVNLTMQHIVSRPRRARALIDVIQEQIYRVRRENAPPPCPNIDTYRNRQSQQNSGVGCLKSQEWLKLEDCWRCYLHKELSNGEM